MSGPTGTNTTAVKARLERAPGAVRAIPDGRASLLGLSFAFMGALKLTGLERGMFRRWGMTSRQMRIVGAVETAGALMVANRETRSIGAAGLAALSAMMLAVEASNGEAELVLPRLGLLVMAVREAVKA